MRYDMKRYSIVQDPSLYSIILNFKYFATRIEAHISILFTILHAHNFSFKVLKKLFLNILKLAERAFIANCHFGEGKELTK